MTKLQECELLVFSKLDYNKASINISYYNIDFFYIKST